MLVIDAHEYVTYQHHLCKNKYQIAKKVFMNVILLYANALFVWAFLKLGLELTSH